MKTKIYGASDDLIELEGPVSDEIDCYKEASDGLSIKCSDNTKARIEYDGEWKIEIEEEGMLFDKIVPSNDEISHQDEDAKDCTSYSDVLVLKEGVTWIDIAGKRFYSR